jgi:hypothetical protein
MTSAHCLLQGLHIKGSIFLSWKLGPFLRIETKIKGLNPDKYYCLYAKINETQITLVNIFRGDHKLIATLHGVDLKPLIGHTMFLDMVSDSYQRNNIASGVIGISHS